MIIRIWCQSCIVKIVPFQWRARQRVACFYCHRLMTDSRLTKTSCQAKAWIANTALLGAIALVIVLFSTPLVVFLVFRDSDLDNWQDRFSTVSQLLDTCDSQSARNTVSGSWPPACLVHATDMQLLARSAGLGMGIDVVRVYTWSNMSHILYHNHCNTIIYPLVKCVFD